MAHNGKKWWQSGWGILIGACIVVTLLIVVPTVGTSEGDFTRKIGWATVFAMVLTLITLIWTVSRPRNSIHIDPAAVADKLTNKVLEDEGDALRGLLYAGRNPGRTANVTYRPENLIHYRSSHAAGDLRGVEDFYTQHTGSRMVVLGPPGGGKTVLAVRLLCDLAKRRKQLEEPKRRLTSVPIRLDLTDWNAALSLRDWLILTLTDRYFNGSIETARELVDAGLILPVLDGLDEMDAPNEEPTRARAAISQLNRHLSGTDVLPVVVTCREEEYRRIGEEVADATVVIIQPLMKVQICSYMTSELSAARDRPALDAWKSVETSLGNGRMFVLLKTPWALTLAVVFLRDGGTATELLSRPGESKGPFPNECG